MLIEKYGIDEDGDGSLSKDEFLNFLRNLVIASVPSSEVDNLKIAYDNALAEHPEEPMDDVRIKKLFNNLGFDVKHPGIHAVLGAVDADGGRIRSVLALAKFLTSVFLQTRW